MTGTDKDRLAELFTSIAKAQPEDFAKADQKIRESKLGNLGPFLLGMIVGALVAEFGAEETDRLMLVFVSSIAAQQGK